MFKLTSDFSTGLVKCTLPSVQDQGQTQQLRPMPQIKTNKGDRVRFLNSTGSYQ